MDNQTVLVRIDVGVAGVRNHEVQAVRRERPVKQMVRRARVLGARLGFGVAQGAHNIFFESRPRAVIRNRGAGHQAPRIVGELLGGCGLNQRVTRHPRQRGTAAEKRAAVKQAVAGNRFQIFQFSL